MKLLALKKFLSFTVIILIFSSFFAVFLAPRSANAGFFDFLGKIWNSVKEEEMIIIPASAATMQLLEAPKTADLKESRAQMILINIVGDGSLVANSGPMGTIVNVENEQSNQISIYTVREGDTLSEIAEMFKINVSTLRWANDLKKDSAIKMGDSLVILPITGVRYEVKKGDTLKAIAKKFSGDEEEIAGFNDIDSKNLAAGEIIIIPNGEIIEVQENERKSQQKNPLAKTPSFIGYYLRPVDGGYKSQNIHGYNGVDIAVSCGSPIYASADGEVIVSRAQGWNGGYGKYIVVSHYNGTQTLYAHNSSNNVINGQKISKGKIIGSVGSTGLSTGCHIHFEIRGAKNPF